MLARLTVFLAGCRPHDFPQYPPNYREYVYVTNGGSDTVTVLDVVNVRVDRELAVGHNPVAVAASPTRNEIYVVNSGAAGANGSLSVIDAEHNAVVATIPCTGSRCPSISTPPATRAYVANSGSNSVSVVDLKARREIAQIAAGEQPVAARLAPDGKTLVVANQQRKLGHGHRSGQRPRARRLCGLSRSGQTWSFFPILQRHSCPARPAIR